jgi:hypothetical protein
MAGHDEAGHGARAAGHAARRHRRRAAGLVGAVGLAGAAELIGAASGTTRPIMVAVPVMIMAPAPMVPTCFGKARPLAALVRYRVITAGDALEPDAAEPSGATRPALGLDLLGLNLFSELAVELFRERVLAAHVLAVSLAP